MAQRILLKDSGLGNSNNPLSGYKFVGYNGLTFSQLDSDGNIVELVGGNTFSSKVYTALLNQSGTNAPIATVLENTLSGPLGWTYSSPGTYRATLTGEFSNSNKVVVFINQAGGFYAVGSGVSIYTTAYVYDNDQIEVITTLDSNLSNGMLLVTPIEIRVYP